MAASKPQLLPDAGHNVSGVLAWVCLALAVSLPILVAWSLLREWPSTLTQALGGATGVVRDLRQIAPWRLIAAAGVGLLPVLVMSAALMRARACLVAFANGAYLTLTPVYALRSFAALALVAAAASAVVPTAAALILTWGAAGGAAVVISFGSQQLLLLVFAALTWQIASVMARAVALAEDHAQIV